MESESPVSSKQEHRVAVDNGKYTFVVPADGYHVAILRHGEPWHEQGEASSALHAMMCELDAARLVVAQARALGQDWRPDAQARLQRLIQIVIQQHDALTSDRLPPSPWTGPCDPPGACATHGRCWPHSEWDDPHDPALREPPVGNRFITVLCKHGHTHVVEAHVFGEWAASRMIAATCAMSPDWWTVTHVPSGLCLSEVVEHLTAREARDAAEQLSTTVPHLESWDEIPADVSKRIRAALELASEAA